MRARPQITDIGVDQANLERRIAFLEQSQSNGLGIWVPIPFQNGWGPYAGTKYYPPSYMVVDQWVRLRGLLAGGTINAVASAGLPPPPRDEVFGPLTSGNVSCRLDITKNGELIPVSGSSAWISLSGISYSLIE